MWLFKKKNNEADDNKKTISDKVADKIAGAGIKIQKAFANKMNKLFEKMSGKRIKIVLIFFCVTAGGYSLYLLANSIFKKENKQQVFKIEQVDVPKHFDKTGDETIMPEAAIDEQTYNQIQDFKKYMDSIQIHSKKEYDSILINRPGLLDSIQMLEQIYLSQKQK